MNIFFTHDLSARATTLFLPSSLDSSRHRRHDSTIHIHHVGWLSWQPLSVGERGGGVVIGPLPRTNIGWISMQVKPRYGGVDPLMQKYRFRFACYHGQRSSAPLLACSTCVIPVLTSGKRFVASAVPVFRTIFAMF